jgi:hypothetical protein
MNTPAPTTDRELTFGEKAVGLTFNPSGDPVVTEIKTLYAKIIDLCNDFRRADGNEMTGDQARLIKIAITEAQGAQMWAVKAATYQF